MATTAIQLAQYTLNLSVALQNQQIQGQAEPATKGDIVAICGALSMLAEAVLVAEGSIPNGGTVPNSLLTGKYSAVVSGTTPIQV